MTEIEQIKEELAATKSFKGIPPIVEATIKKYFRWLSFLLTTIEQKNQLNAGLCKTVLKQETTIESQKEEIDWKIARIADLEQELVDQKAITELAVKGLKELQRYTAPDYPFKTAETIAEFHTLIGLTLSEIARLSQ